MKRSTALDAALDLHCRTAVLKAVGRLTLHTDPRWTSGEDQGLYASIRKAVSAAKLPREVADEVVQDILAGFTVKDGIFAYVAARHATAIRAGKGPSVVQADLSHHAYHRALQVARKRPVDADAYAEATQTEEASSEEFVDVDEAATVLRRAFTIEFRDAPVKMSTFDLWMSDPSQTALEIGRKLGNLAVYEWKGKPIPIDIQFRSDAEMRDWRKAHPGCLIMATQTSKVLREIWELIEGARTSRLGRVVGEAENQADLVNLTRGTVAA